jgi:hypothetical protein
MPWAKAGRYNRNALISSTGNAQPGVTIEVFEEDTLFLADLFVDEDKAVPKANPIISDAQGEFEFCADPGVYDVRFTLGLIVETVKLAVPAQGDENDTRIDGAITIGNAAQADATAAQGTADGAQAAAEVAQNGITNHQNDPADAHDASAVSVVPCGNLTATDAQAALCELDSDLSAHLTDAVDAHDASAVSFTPTGTIAATDVQAAISEALADAVAASLARIKHGTAPLPSVDAASSVNIVVPFVETDYPDTAYAATATVETEVVLPANAQPIFAIIDRTVADVTVQVINLGIVATGAGFVHVLACHD